MRDGDDISNVLTHKKDNGGSIPPNSTTTAVGIVEMGLHAICYK